MWIRVWDPCFHSYEISQIVLLLMIPSKSSICFFPYFFSHICPSHETILPLVLHFANDRNLPKQMDVMTKYQLEKSALAVCDLDYHGTKCY